MDEKNQHFDKWAAVALQMGSAFLFFAAGSMGGHALVIAGALGCGIGGLRLWGHGAKVAAPRNEDRQALDGRFRQLQEQLASMQEDLSHLREDRDFFRELYSPDEQHTLLQGRPIRLPVTK